jgi:hypothetical protein
MTDRLPPLNDQHHAVLAAMVETCIEHMGLEHFGTTMDEAVASVIKLIELRYVKLVYDEETEQGFKNLRLEVIPDA